MDNLFHTSEKMKYTSAMLYPLQGKTYSTVETESKFFFGWQNGDILETITVFSKDVRFLCNDSHTNIYAIEIVEEQLKITVLPEQNEHFFELSSADEFVIGLTAGNRSLLIKTCRDLSDDDQKINMYYIDIKTDKIMLCDDIMMNESYHIPYISICEDEEYILAESAVIQGKLISNLDYSALMSENDEIELNEVLSILDERYVVFHATDYSRDESYQCRVV